jgi:hypothetical protein
MTAATDGCEKHGIADGGLPPLLQNSGGWWHLKYHNTGLAEGEAGWYLHEFQDRRVIDTYARIFHIARSTAERILPGLIEAPGRLDS